MWSWVLMAAGFGNGEVSWAVIFPFTLMRREVGLRFSGTDRVS